MKKNTRTLRIQFLTRLFMVMVIVALLSGGIQLVLIKNQITQEIENNASVLTQSIEQGIKATNLASEAIEEQIDLKMVSYSKYIATLLDGLSVDEISQERLTEISNDLNLAGITIFVEAEDDIVGVQSTNPDEIGFGFKDLDPKAYETFRRLIHGQEVEENPFFNFIDQVLVLPISQSGSHGDTPTFFKYSYYSPEGESYLINPYIEADHVYQFTNNVGPDAWIKNFLEDYPIVVEMAVLNPKVFKDPSLEEELFPPLKRIEYGSFDTKTSKDEETLISLASNLEKVHYRDNQDDYNLYKMFITLDGEKVAYIALDYGMLSAPLIQHSVVLIVTGLLSLVALFILAARFFNAIYINLQKITSQIKKLEVGDFTARSDVNDGSELTNLSLSMNKMVDSLQNLLLNSSEQASSTQKLSLLLENEANESVEEMYTLSMEATTHHREVVYEIVEFLDEVEQHLRQSTDKDVTTTLGKIDKMREIARNRSVTVTDMTITLSDLLKSLHGQSKELSTISNHLLKEMSKFKLEK